MIKVNVPGFTNSGPAHWQTLWEKEDSSFIRAEQADWDNPGLDEWVKTLDRTLAGLNESIILVGHSLGALTIVHWASRHVHPKVAGAFLVAPADTEDFSAPKEITGFAPVPLRTLPFPSLLVASEDDTFLSVERARFFAESWGSLLAETGRKGHINTASNLGNWDEGKQLLNKFMLELSGSRDISR